MTATLCPLAVCNAKQIERLLDAAFGPDRKNRTAYLLRPNAQQFECLSFGLEANGRLIGTIQCWPVEIAAEDRAAPLVLVGPVAVDPDNQSSGHGHRLMHAILDAAKPLGDPPMVMIGDSEYYGRFGFSADDTGGWTLPGPWDARRLLLRNPAGHPLPQHGKLRERMLANQPF